MNESSTTPIIVRSSTQMSPSDSEQTEPKSVYVSTNAASTSLTAANPYNLCEYNLTPDMLSQSLNITLKFISPAASSGPFCRICHEGDAHEDLVSLCKCTGSVGLVHITCIERWLSTRRNGTGRDQCEICNYTFQTVRYPKSLVEWYQSSQGSMPTRHSVLGDVACFSLITPLAAVSTFLCIEGAKQHVKWNNSLEAGCLMALATFLVTVYLVWNVLTVRYHLKSYYRWRTLNQNVRLVGFRKTTAEPDSHRMDSANAVHSMHNGNSRTEVIANDRISPESHPSTSEAIGTHTQTSSSCAVV